MSRIGKCRVSAKASVTAGLMWAPEMCPVAVMTTMTTSPKTMPMPSVPMGSPVSALMTMAPAPTKTRMNVPTNSVKYRVRSLLKSNRLVTCCALLLVGGCAGLV